MIGLVGPEDSVALALRAAAEIGLSDSVIARTYDAPDQAPGLARELDPVCQVVLFTGRVPYAFTATSGEHRAQLDWVAHSGIDLYRSLVELLRAHAGRLPTLSIDTIESEVVAEVWRDLSLDPPTTVLPLTDVSVTEEIVAFHLDAWRSGAVEACLTCLRSVYDDLAGQGVPVFRVEHTRAAVRDALERAHRVAQTVQTEAHQVAVGLLEVAPGDREWLDHLVTLLHGRVQEVDERTTMIFTTWGALQNELNRGRLVRPRSALGFGLGATLPRAEENARRALSVARIDGTPSVVFTDGTVRRLDDSTQVDLPLRHSDPRTLELARALDMSPTSVHRLAAALQGLDPRAITAQDLAEALHVGLRSARRILSKLERNNIVARSGTVTGPGAGRPRTVYIVDVERLLPEGAHSARPGTMDSGSSASRASSC